MRYRLWCSSVRSKKRSLPIQMLELGRLFPAGRFPMPIKRVTSATIASKPATKIGFVSLGCPKNLVDSEVMMGLLAQAGAKLTPNAEDADVIVVNTCSFIGSAQQESIDTILEMARHKIGGTAKRLVVAGCLVERFHDEILKNIPEVDAVVGTGELDKILAAAGIAPAPQTSSPFNILVSNDNSSNSHTSRPEGDHRRTQ